MQVCSGGRGRGFTAKGPAGAKNVRWERSGGAWGTAGWPVWLEQRRRGTHGPER